jgi:hypothetical protein
MKQPLSPVFLLFGAVSISAWLLQGPLERIGMDIAVLLVGNLLLFAISLVSYALHRGGMKARGGAMFLGSVYGAFLLRMAVAAAAVLAYGFWKRSDINRPALFTCMFLYLVYTFLETRALLRNQGGRHAKD